MAALWFDLPADTDEETGDDETDHAPEAPRWQGIGYPFLFAMHMNEDEFIPPVVLLHMGLGDIMHELTLIFMANMDIVWLLLLVCGQI